MFPLFRQAQSAQTIKIRDAKQFSILLIAKTSLFILISLILTYDQTLSTMNIGTSIIWVDIQFFTGGPRISGANSVPLNLSPGVPDSNWTSNSRGSEEIQAVSGTGWFKFTQGSRGPLDYPQFRRDRGHRLYPSTTALKNGVF